jgi:hypothetical protein
LSQCIHRTCSSLCVLFDVLFCMALNLWDELHPTDLCCFGPYACVFVCLWLPWFIVLLCRSALYMYVHLCVWVHARRGDQLRPRQSMFFVVGVWLVGWLVDCSVESLGLMFGWLVSLLALICWLACGKGGQLMSWLSGALCCLVH